MAFLNRRECEEGARGDESLLLTALHSGRAEIRINHSLALLKQLQIVPSKTVRTLQ